MLVPSSLCGTEQSVSRIALACSKLKVFTEKKTPVSVCSSVCASVCVCASMHLFLAFCTSSLVVVGHFP